METKRRCSSCGRLLEEVYEFCPFDGTPLSRKCSTCGKSWDVSFQFCPEDSTPLGRTAAAGTTAAPPERKPQPPPGTPTTYTPKPTEFTFATQVARPPWKAILTRPLTILFAAGVVATATAVWYLNWVTSGPDLPPPVVGYTLLPNEGKSKGVPVVVKINQLVVFLIDDPVEGGEGANRAKKLVATLQEVLRPLTAKSEIRFAVDAPAGGPPQIVEVLGAGGEKRTLATVTEGDVTLAGETDAGRLAAQWAERLTDAVKVFVFGEMPTFSARTDFGRALLAMHKSAAGMDSRGRVSKKNLDNAFARLSPEQRKALETPVIARP